MTGQELHNGMLAAFWIEEFLLALAYSCAWVIAVRNAGEPWDDSAEVGGYETREAALLDVQEMFGHKPEEDVRVYAVAE